MRRKGFTLIELLIVVAIIAALTGVALPYYQNYVKETKIAKAKYELDIVKEALVKFDTFEDKKFEGTDLTVLMGKYLQTLNVDPWGRGYLVEVASGQLRSLGPDSNDPKDDIVVDYKPPLALLTAKWIDVDRNQHISHLDLIQLEFTRYLIPNLTPQLGNPSLDSTGMSFDLQLSNEVKFGAGGLVASTTLASSTETYLWVDLGIPGAIDDTVFYPGSSTIKVASGNDALLDFSGRKANGSVGEYKALEVTIKPN